MTRPALKRNAELKSLCKTGKRRFRSEQAAQKALASDVARRETGDPRRHEIRYYQCDKGCEGWHLTSQPAAPLRTTKPLPPQSKKRAKEQRERTAMLKETFGPDPMCAVTGCPQPADDAHEPLTRARGGSITDPANVKPICRAHHDLLTFAPESELEWAYEAGLLVHSWEASA